MVCTKIFHIDSAVNFNTLDNNGVDSDDTQAEDPDQTYVSEVDDHSLLVPDSLEQAGCCFMRYKYVFIWLIIQKLLVLDIALVKLYQGETH